MKYLWISIGFLIVFFFGNWLSGYLIGSNRKVKKIFPDDNKLIKNAKKK
jgi:hypothetical protein